MHFNVQIDTEDGEVQLVRVRNPWGNECEWKGAWSDQLVWNVFTLFW